MNKIVRRIVWCGVSMGTLAVVVTARLHAWGEAGHRLTAQAAVATLPAAMPAFFRNAAGQLAYLNPEPDRWREHTEHDLDPALDVAASQDHFIDLEMIPAAHRAGVLAAPTRYAYLDSLRALGVDGVKVGFLPFRILELTQRLRIEFRLWRAAPDTATRLAIEARIINDGGILGHYVADGSNPAHTTVQFNGWTGPNPNGYATDKQFHARFESGYVQSYITIGDVQPLVEATVHVYGDIRPAVIEYLGRSNGEVEQMYRLDKTAHFGPQSTSPEGKRFVAQRLAAGAQMLRDLWWTAWVTSDK